VNAHQPAGVEEQRRGVRDVGRADEISVIVKLHPPRGAVAFGQVGAACRLVLEPQLVRPGLEGRVGVDAEHLPAEIVVDVVQLLVLDEERVAAGRGPLAEQHSLGAVRWDLGAGRDAVRTVEHTRGGEERHRLRPREQHVLIAGRCRQGLLHRSSEQAAAVDRHHVVLSGLDVPAADHLDQLLAILGSHVTGLGEVLGDVIELPAIGVELGQRRGRDRLAKPLTRLLERRTGPRADRPPAVVVDRAVAKHLEVLRVPVALSVSIVERVREAHPVQRRLGDAPNSALLRR
jgi:hypothetical protein